MSRIDTTQIPEGVGKRIGQCIIAGLRKYMEQPGAREALDARTKARQERRKASEGSLPQVQGLEAR